MQSSNHINQRYNTTKRSDLYSLNKILEFHLKSPVLMRREFLQVVPKYTVKKYNTTFVSVNSNNSMASLFFTRFYVSDESELRASIRLILSFGIGLPFS